MKESEEFLESVKAMGNRALIVMIGVCMIELNKRLISGRCEVSK